MTAKALRTLSVREERYCQLVVDGVPQYEAHKKVGFKAKTAASHAVHASLMMKRQEIRDRIQELRDIASEEAIISRNEVVRFLADVIRTPVGKVDEMNPLAQEVHRESRMRGRGEDAEEYEVTKIKIPDKLGAVNHIAKILGFNAPDKLEVSGAVEVIEFE